MENGKAKESTENIYSSLGLEGRKPHLVYSSETSGISMALSVFCSKGFFFHTFCFSCILQLSHFTGQGILNDVNSYLHVSEGYDIKTEGSQQFLLVSEMPASDNLFFFQCTDGNAIGSTVQGYLEQRTKNSLRFSCRPACVLSVRLFTETPCCVFLWTSGGLLAGSMWTTCGLESQPWV